MINPDDERTLRLITFAVISALIGSRDCYMLEQTSEDTGHFDGYGNPVPSVDKARLSATALAQIRAASKAVGDTVIEEVRRLRLESVCSCCEGTGLEVTDRATCITCKGSGKTSI